MSDAESPGTIYLVDGTAQLYRAYFALPGLTNSEGMPVHAVYGYLLMLRKLIKDESPHYMAVAFDTPGKVFRHEQYAEYKANRPETPEDLRTQIPYAKQVSAALGIPVVEKPGFEADDVIAAYTRRAREKGLEVVVVSSDKDLLQLVGDGVRVLNPNKMIVLDSAGVVEQFGVAPEHVTDVLGMMGDSVDNIPGVPGVGGKTAVAVVRTYGDVESVIARAGRFTAAFDSRDRLLETLATIAKSPSLDAEAAHELVERAAQLGPALAGLIDGEPDGEFRERMQRAAERLGEADVPAIEARLTCPGRAAAKPFAALKKELKSMDRGSSRRAWYLIREHAEQARMSKQLATLQPDVPLETPLEELVLREPDRESAVALFRALGFRTLITEFSAPTNGEEIAAETSRWPERSYETVLGEEGLARLVGACRKAGRCGIATMTEGASPMQAKLVGVALSPADGQACYVPLRHEYLGAPTQLSAETASALLGSLMADNAVAKLAHDLKFEDHLLRRHGLPVAGWTCDTMVLAFLLNSGRSDYGIDKLSREFLGVEPSAGAAESSAERTTETPIEAAARVAAGKADRILALDRAMAPLIERSGLRNLYDRIDGPLLPLLARMEASGIRVDVALLEKMSGEMETVLGRSRAEIHRLAGSEFNVDSPKQLREVLFERLGLRPGRKTAKSRVASTDAQTLEELARDHAIARQILAYRETAKLKGTYVDALPRLVNPGSGRVHTSFHPTGAATGRLSSSDPNLQNIPARTAAGREIRSAFVPEEGFRFLASDYSQIELRVLAHLTGDAELVAAFQAGEDIHRFTAAQVFGVIPGLVTDEMRRRAKAVNFGILYGMSETRLAREQGMKRTEARAFIHSYFERFASVRGYIDEVRERVRRDGAVRTLFGRVRYFPQLREKLNRAVQEQALRAAVNTTIQGTAADLMKLAMLRVDEALQGAGSQARILLQVHDELLLEVPEAEVEGIRKTVRAAMESVHPLKVPLVVDLKVGNSWLDVT